LTAPTFDFSAIILTAAIGLASAIIASVITAIVSVQLALRRFRAEKYWELRAQAYTKIVEAIHDASVSASENLEASIDGRELSADRKNELQDRSRDGTDRILRALDTGALLLPSEAIDRLRQYLRDSDTARAATDWNEFLSIETSAAQSCLQDITKIARRDLKIKG
jgi:hypothetical protein